MEENNIEFGKWVTTHREALANLYFSFFESVMGDQVRNDEEGDIIPLDEFVVKIYSENKDIVELWYVKNNKENPEEDLGFGNQLDFSRN